MLRVAAASCFIKNCSNERASPLRTPFPVTSQLEGWKGDQWWVYIRNNRIHATSSGHVNAWPVFQSFWQLPALKGTSCHPVDRPCSLMPPGSDRLHTRWPATLCRRSVCFSHGDHSTFHCLHYSLARYGDGRVACASGISHLPPPIPNRIHTYLSEILTNLSVISDPYCRTFCNEVLSAFWRLFTGDSSLLESERLGGRNRFCTFLL